VISASTFVFALVLSVAASGALAWPISSTLAKAAEAKLSTTANALSVRATHISRAVDNVRTQLAELERHSPKKLSAEVAALSEAVESLSATHRRFAGKVWQKIGDRKPESDDLARVGNGIASDDELAAVLALQTAGPVRPES